MGQLEATLPPLQRPGSAKNIVIKIEVGEPSGEDGLAGSDEHPGAAGAPV